jgi:hypothetical protein
MISALARVGVATALLPPNLARVRPIEDPLILLDPASEDDEDEDSEEDVVLNMT